MDTDRIRIFMVDTPGLKESYLLSGFSLRFCAQRFRLSSIPLLAPEASAPPEVVGEDRDFSIRGEAPKVEGRSECSEALGPGGCVSL